MFGGLAPEVDLHEQLRRGARVDRSGVDRLEEPPAVYGMNGPEVGNRLANLVRLQRTDQMPSDLKVG